MPRELDSTFKALADPTRRQLLDRLHERNGQTLGELCAELEMRRQSATQHLDILEAATLISTVRRGREKLHYLNPVRSERRTRFGAVDCHVHDRALRGHRPTDRDPREP